MAKSIPDDTSKRDDESEDKPLAREVLAWDDEPTQDGHDKTSGQDKAKLLESVPSMEKTEEAPASHEAHSEAAAKGEDGAAKPEAAARVSTLTSTPVVPASEVSEGEAAQPKTRRSHGKRVGIAAGVIIAGLAAVYVGGSVFYSSHFLPNTTVNGEDVSGMSASELASTITEQGEDYVLTLSGDNLSVVIKGSDIDLSYDGDTYASSALSQENAWTWPAAFFSSRDYTASQGVSYDSDKLESLVSAAVDAVDAGASQPTNATITYNSDTKQFEITPEQYGTAVDKDSVLKLANEAVSGLSSTVELGQDELVQPTVTSDDETLKASVDEANQMVQTTIPLNINGSEVAEVTSDQIAGWLTTDDTGSVSLDTDAITTWTQGDLSKQFDSVGTSRTYTRADGKEVTVSGGTYGWSIDGATLAQTIAQQILDGNSTAIDVPMKSSAAVWNPGGAEWKAYIDVDLTEQHARYYDDDGNIIWESDFVSGNPTEGNATPTGVYSINSNMQTGNVELRGLDEDGDGEPDYISYVTYWMPFIDNLVAFHDASWRGTFGGDIYTYNGSHGCINLPSSAAQELYGMVSVGTVVVVHE